MPLLEQTSWAPCYLTPWTLRTASFFSEGGASLQLHRRDSALSGCVFTVGHCSVPPYSEAILHCSVRTTVGRRMPPSGLLEGLTLFAENTGLIVGRTLVDPSRWKVPVLVSNFSQDTSVVAPFSEVGMIAQVSAIQSIMEPHDQPQETLNSLPTHLHDLVSQIRRPGCQPTTSARKHPTTICRLISCSGVHSHWTHICR